MKNLIFDIEGVLIKDKTFTPVDGALFFFKELKEKNIKYLLASNNTSHDPVGLINSLNNSGFDFSVNELVTCLDMALDELRSRNAESCVILALDPVIEFLKAEGINVIENDSADAVVVGLDLNISYSRYKMAVNALLNDAEFIALHKNRLYKDIDGKYGISAGGITKALEYSVGREAFIVGKPSRRFYEKCLEKIRTEPEHIMFISDDPFSDLIGAKDMGMKTCFALSGKYSSANILTELPDKYQPDIICKNIKELLRPDFNIF